MCILHVRFYDCRQHRQRPDWVTPCEIVQKGGTCDNSIRSLAGKTGQGGMRLDDSRAEGCCPIHGPYNPHDED